MKINCLEYFKPVLGDVNPARVKFLVTQDHKDEYEEGMKLLDELAEYAGSFKRQKVSAGLLQIGVNAEARMHFQEFRRIRFADVLRIMWLNAAVKQF